MSDRRHLLVILTIACVVFLVATHMQTLGREQEGPARSEARKREKPSVAYEGTIAGRAQRAEACLTWEEKWHAMNNHFRPAPAKPSDNLTAADRTITQMVLSVKGVITEKQVDIPIRDPEVLQRLQNAMAMPLRYGYPNDGTCGGGVGCGGAFAVLKVSATDGDFEIGICLAGFLIDANAGPNFNNLFFSWTLADRLDQIWFQAEGKHFPDSLFEDLSGISWLKSQGWRNNKVRSQREK